jgi:hypothetical protein
MPKKRLKHKRVAQQLPRPVTICHGSKENIAVCSKSIGDEGYGMAVVLSNDPAVIDAIVCQTVHIPKKQLRLLHMPAAWGTWTTDSDWKKNNPGHATDDIPLGYMCDHCHEPVIAGFALDPEASEDPDDVEVDPDNLTEHNGQIIVASPKILHVRQLCGCSMVLMDPTTLPWWSEINCHEIWNTFVQGAKDAQTQYFNRALSGAKGFVNTERG